MLLQLKDEDNAIAVDDDRSWICWSSLPHAWIEMKQTSGMYETIVWHISFFFLFNQLFKINLLFLLFIHFTKVTNAMSI